MKIFKLTRRKSIILLLLIIFISNIILGIILSNNLDVEIIKINYQENKDYIRILHISDLHFPNKGISLDKIEKKVNDINPDLIFLTGDIIDRKTSLNEINSLSNFLSKINKNNNTYAVHGNHETLNRNLKQYSNLLAENNIILLENTFNLISFHNKNIIIAGLNDNNNYYCQELFNDFDVNDDDIVLLLAHRPEKIDSYISKTNKIKPLITFSGHAHGGQFVLFGKGMIAPDQGFLPEYHNGLYSFQDSYLIVSRGLGESIIPFRLYNNYHMPLIELYL